MGSADSSSNRHFRLLLCLVLLACALTPAHSLSGDASAAAAREISGKWGDAVIAVKVVLSMRTVMEGREVDEEERTSQLNATVIDPSGLAVCSLSEADPSHVMEQFAEEDSDYRLEASVKDVKMLLADGKELPAKVVLRDKDLDLAFVQPAEPPAEPMSAVDLSQSGSPEILDQVVVLGRLGEVVNRAPSVSLDRVQAIARKPRTVYITGLNAWVAGLGCPAFTLDGKLVGVLVIRAVPAASIGASRGEATSLPVVLPAEDIREVAQQAAK